METDRNLPRELIVRPIRPTDVLDLERFYAGLSEDARNARFHGATRGIEDAAARSFCGPDHAHREGLVAVLRGAASDRSTDGRDDRPSEPIIGHLCLEPGAPGEVEMAVAVADAWQHRGVGRALLAAAIAWAEANGIERLRAEIRWSNPAILRLLRSAERPLTLAATDDGDLEARLDIRGRVPAAA
jgi:GNAT superfamily N-acetyltransferase